MEKAKSSRENGQIPKCFYKSAVPLADRIEEPSPGKGPVTPRSALADAERLGGFFDAQADEVAQLDHLGFLGVHRGKPLDGLVNGEEALVGVRSGNFDPIEVRALL